MVKAMLVSSKTNGLTSIVKLVPLEDHLVFINTITLAAIAGIWIASQMTLPLFLLSALAIIFFALALRGSKQHPANARWFIIVVFLLLGAIRFIHDQTPAVDSVSRYIGQTVVVQGTIAEEPQRYIVNSNQARVRYHITTSQILLGTEKNNRCSGDILVNIRQNPDDLIGRVGDHIIVKGELIELHGFNNPGLIDTVAALKRAGVVARITASGEDISIRSAARYGWENWVSELREAIFLTMKKVMPPADAAMLFGMLFGGYHGIEPDVIAAFSATGIIHILSVSGTHIALVAGSIYWICYRLRLSGGQTAFLVALIILGYACLAGFSSPVIRSALMGLLAVGAVALRREKDSCYALALVALGMVLYQPSLIYDIGFQLSFGATAGLLYLFAGLYTQLKLLPNWLAGPIAVTLAAQLGVLPFIAWYFKTLSLSAVVANVVIVPVVEFVVILGLIGVITALGWGVLGDFLLGICGAVIQVIQQLTMALAAIPGGNIDFPPIGIVAGCGYYLLLWLISQRGLSVMTVARRWPYRCLGGVLIIVCAVLWYSILPSPLRVHFIDVGQGDSALLITPHGRTVLIDTGGITASAVQFDIGERVVVPYLKHQGVQRLDYLILTHGHQDHAGGAAAVAKHIPVKQILLAREAYSPAVQELIKAAQNSIVIPAYAAQKILLDDVVIDMVYAVDSKNEHSGNEASNVIRIGYGAHSFLITGDLEQQGETAILASGTSVASTVLKVGHHGAKTSTSPEFLQAVAPRYAVISVGVNNRFGHPHREILNRLTEAQIEIFRTDLDGAIVFETDGKKLTGESFIH